MPSWIDDILCRRKGSALPPPPPIATAGNEGEGPQGGADELSALRVPSHGVGYCDDGLPFPYNDIDPPTKIVQNPPRPRRRAPPGPPRTWNYSAYVYGSMGGARRPPCQYFMAGHCRDGDNCRFLHYEDDAAREAMQHEATVMNIDGNAADVDRMTYEELLELGGRIGKAEEPRRAAIAAAKRLPVITFEESAAVLPQREGGATHDTTCLVCLADFAPSDQLMLLPCLHRYHQTCAMDWFSSGGTAKCPACKADIREQGEEIFNQLFL